LKDLTTRDNIEQVIDRLEVIKKNCFITPNPMYTKWDIPTEYQDLKLKVEELKAKLK